MRDRNLSFYALMFLILGGGVLAFLHYGRNLQWQGQGTATSPGIVVPAGNAGATEAGGKGTTDTAFWKEARDRIAGDPGRLILQLLAILAVTRVAGRAAKAIGQPEVVGEMAAGILLGPTLFGRLAPSLSAGLFPPASLPQLGALGQIGVLLFLFLVGLEMDLGTLHKRARAAVLISHASILFPFFLGVAMTFAVFRDHARTGFVPTALFLGISMSVTAFPVLARILFERRMEETPLGVMAIAAAAIDDATAWCLLAMVIAIAKSGSLSGFAFAIASTAAVIIGIWAWGRPALAALLDQGKAPESASRKTLVYALGAAFASSLLTELAGIHAMFGAFLAGAAMPRHPKLRLFLRTRLEPLCSGLLLPIFFVMTGLRAEIGILASREGLLLSALVIAVAILGKFGGTLAASRCTGMAWADAARLGVLMNTRGLMELVILNIGYDMGILSGTLFTAMVMMALVTTALTAPGLWALRKLSPRTHDPGAGSATYSPAIDSLQTR
jgi:Kef-type K+ transport system membrane component KefB